ncbi:FMRFamide related propeptide isoform X2 [Rhynchophorus ferrugineus]
MGTSIIFLAFFIFQSVLSYTDDAYEHFEAYAAPEDAEVESYNERKPRSDKFLRFGKRLWDYETNNDLYEDSNIPRPPRTGSFSKNTQQRAARDSSYIRFGRSINSTKSRGKRAAPSASSSENSKRHENFLRFGRNSNFMRFGRAGARSAKEEMLKRLLDSSNEPLVAYLRNLMLQSEDGELSEM